MADFHQVQSMQTSAGDSDLKGLLQLKIAGAAEPLSITADSLSDAEDVADLIDGYCRLVNSGNNSCWNRKGERWAELDGFLLYLWAWNSWLLLAEHWRSYGVKPEFLQFFLQCKRDVRNYVWHE